MSDTFAAAPRPKIPVIRTAYDGYRLAIGAIFSSGAMFRFFVYGALLILAVLAAEIYLSLLNAGVFSGALASRPGPWILFNDAAIGLGSYLLLAAVQAPLGIAVQRRILLNETPSTSYFSSARYGSGFLRTSFVIYTAFFFASLAYIPAAYLIYGISPVDDNELGLLMTSRPGSIGVIVLAWCLAYFVACVFSVRSAFAFPVAACGGAYPSLRRSFAETRGSAVRLYFLFVFIVIPAFGLYMIVGVTAVLALTLPVLMGSESGDDMVMAMLLSPQMIIAAVLIFLTFMLLYVAIAAGAARAYQIRVERGLSGVAEVFS